jgi:hypothetical protein
MLQAEMEKVISLGVDPLRIIFAHPCKCYMILSILSKDLYYYKKTFLTFKGRMS